MEDVTVSTSTETPVSAPVTPSAEPAPVATPVSISDGIPEGTEIGDTAPDFGLRPLRERSDSTGRSKKPATPAKSSAFDVNGWDGDIQKLPPDVRDFVDILAKRKYSSIEAEFTSKRGELERAYKAEAKQEPGAEARVTELEKELELYKLLAEGAEDPRVPEMTTKLSEWESKYNDLNSRFSKMQEEADHRWVTEFKAKHAEIFADKEKSTKLLDYVEKGWDEEAAAQLVTASNDVIRMATDLIKQHKLGPEGHVFAIQHAKMKLGVDLPPRKARPAAELTSGATGQRNPSRVPGGSLRELPRHEARAEAARLALAVDNRRKT
jgi:hypothetical protein